MTAATADLLPMHVQGCGCEKCYEPVVPDPPEPVVITQAEIDAWVAEVFGEG